MSAAICLNCRRCKLRTFEKNGETVPAGVCSLDLWPEAKGRGYMRALRSMARNSVGSLPEKPGDCRWFKFMSDTLAEHDAELRAVAVELRK